jgi:hypothetical protein
VDDFDSFYKYLENEPTMIVDHYFETYVKDFTEEVGYLSDMKNNPLKYHIDWQSWIEEVEQDYTQYSNPFDDNLKMMVRGY